MTARDLQVLRMVAAGLRTCDIARELCLSERVVERHLFQARRSLGAKTTPEAVAKMLLNKDWRKCEHRQAPAVTQSSIFDGPS